jgi:hypothetical protein
MEESQDRERDYLEQERVNSQKSFDKSLLMLSAGEIVVSVTLVTNYENIINKQILIISWVMLFISLMSQLTSHHFAIKAFNKALDNHDKKGCHSKECCCCDSNEYIAWVDICNMLSFIFFSFGSIMFLYFVSSNL